MNDEKLEFNIFHLRLYHKESPSQRGESIHSRLSLSLFFFPAHCGHFRYVNIFTLSFIHPFLFAVDQQHEPSAPLSSTHPITHLHNHTIIIPCQQFTKAKWFYKQRSICCTRWLDETMIFRRRLRTTRNPGAKDKETRTQDNGLAKAIASTLLTYLSSAVYDIPGQTIRPSYQFLKNPRYFHFSLTFIHHLFFRTERVSAEIKNVLLHTTNVPLPLPHRACPADSLL